MHLLLLRSLFREMISDLVGSAPTAEEPNRGGMTRYLIVVARTEPAVYEHLRNRHLGDPKVRVMLDRRGAVEYESSENPPPVDRRRRRSSLMTGASHELVAIVPEVPAESPTPNPQLRAHYEEAPRQMSQIETVDDAQRTTRWLAESQYQLSHVIPSLVEERDRLRRALESREQECERLGGELGELRRIHGALQGELDALRGERTAVAEAFGGVASRMMRAWNERRPLANADAVPRRRPSPPRSSPPAPRSPCRCRSPSPSPDPRCPSSHRSPCSPRGCPRQARNVCGRRPATR